MQAALSQVATSCSLQSMRLAYRQIHAFNYGVSFKPKPYSCATCKYCTSERVYSPLATIHRTLRTTGYGILNDPKGSLEISTRQAVWVFAFGEMALSHGNTSPRVFASVRRKQMHIRRGCSLEVSAGCQSDNIVLSETTSNESHSHTPATEPDARIQQKAGRL